MPFDSQLVEMIKKKKNEEAKAIIDSKMLHNAVDLFQNSLLHYAAEYGNIEMLKYLLKSGSKINAQNDRGETPLMKNFLSDSHMSMKVIKILLKAGASLYLQNFDGECVLSIVGSSKWLNKNAKSFDILRKLWDMEYLCLELLTFLTSDNKKDIEGYLKTNVDLSKVDWFGDTIVHSLISNPHAIELLHDKNFDINVRNCKYYTPLMWLIFSCDPIPIRTVEFLLNRGADLSGIGMNGNPDFYEIINRILFLARKLGHLQSSNKYIFQILLENGARVQRDDSRVYVLPENLFDLEIEDLEQSVRTTIFEIFREFANYELAELVLAHMAFQEAALGVSVTAVNEEEINNNSHYKSFFKCCQQQLCIEICPSVKMLDALTGSADRKLERLFRNEELAVKLLNFHTSIDYFNVILRKRFRRARRVAKSKKEAAMVISNLLKMDYWSHPSVIDDIVVFLDKNDIQSLMSIGNDII